MTSEFYLSIKDFPSAGKNFKSGIESWSFRQINTGNMGLGQDNLQTRAKALSPLTVVRRQDRFSNIFLSFGVSPDQKSITRIIFPEASLILDTYGRPDSLISRMIYDFSDFEVIRWIENPKWETERLESISFNFTEVVTFYSAVESITVP